MICRVLGFLFVLALVLAVQGYAYERFPLYVVDTDGDPLTGQTIKAAVVSSSPPTYVGDPATEVGSGEYYFKVGTGVGEIPSGYYDVYRNGVLSDAWRNIYIGLGNVPPANSIDSTHVKNGGLTLSKDIRTAYGLSTALGGTSFLVNWTTLNISPGREDALKFTATNVGSGTSKYPNVATLTLENTSRAVDDASASPRGLRTIVYTDPIRTNPLTEWLGLGPFGAYHQLRVENRGIGNFVNLVRGTQLGYSLPIKVAGYGFVVCAESLGTWWNPGGSSYQVAGIAGKVYANHIAEAIGFLADVYGDSSVPWVYGSHVRAYGSSGGGGYSQIVGAYYGEANGTEDVCVFKGEAVGRALMARAYGIRVAAYQDTTYGRADELTGASFEAESGPWTTYQRTKRAYGVAAIAGADTAYGGALRASGDQSSANNKAFGVRGSAARSSKNYGVYGEAVKATSGVENYGVYGVASGGSVNWSGYFSGKVASDQLMSPATADTVIGYRCRYNAEVTSATGIAFNGKTAGGGTAFYANAVGPGVNYGFYADPGGDDYSFYSTSGSASINDLTAAGRFSLVNYPIEASQVSGQATIPSGVDTVRVGKTAGLLLADTKILLTASGSEPSGHLYCSSIRPTGAGSGFTIKITGGAVGSDLVVSWFAVD